MAFFLLAKIKATHTKKKSKRGIISNKREEMDFFSSPSFFCHIKSTKHLFLFFLYLHSTLLPPTVTDNDGFEMISFPEPQYTLWKMNSGGGKCKRAKKVFILFQFSTINFRLFSPQCKFRCLHLHPLASSAMRKTTKGKKSNIVNGWKLCPFYSVAVCFFPPRNKCKL